MSAPSSPAPRKTRFRSPLTRQIALILLAFTLVPLLVMATAATIRNRTLLFGQLTVDIDNQASRLANTARANLNSKNENLAFISTNQAFLTALERMHRLRAVGGQDFALARAEALLQFEATNRTAGPLGFDEILYLTPEGNILLSSNLAWQNLSLSGSPYYRQILGGENITIALYDFKPFYPEQLVFLTIERAQIPNLDQSGLLVGITEAPRIISSLLVPPTTLYPGTRTFLALPEGVLLQANEDRTALITLTASDRAQTMIAAELTSRAAGNAPATLDYVNNAGNAVLANVQWFPGLDLGVVVEVPQANFASALLSLVPFTATLVLFSLLAAGVAVWTAVAGLVQPIVQLTEVTQSIAAGDWDKRAVVRRKDELGQLAASFNSMADQLAGLYSQLEQRVEERTRQIRTAAEVAQDILASPSIDLLLSKATRLIGERFGYYHTAIYLVDAAGKFAVLRAAHGPAAEQMLARGYRLEIGSGSIIGWVSGNNQVRVSNDVGQDPIHLRYDLLPDTRAEAGIPISVGSLVLGVLDVQSTRTGVFDNEAIIVLQTLANQLAAAIQNANLAASAQVNVQEIERMYRASHQLAQARDEAALFRTLAEILKDSPYLSALYLPTEDGRSLRLLAPPAGSDTRPMPQQLLDLRPDDLNRILAGESVVLDLNRPSNIPQPLLQAARQTGAQTVAFLPAMRGKQLAGLILLGTRQRGQLTPPDLRPYVNLIELINATLEKLNASAATEQRLSELQAIAAAARDIAGATDMNSLYASLYQQIRRAIGNYNFLVALYDRDTDSISVPYMVEDGQVSSLDAFPLGEGLTSILIRTREPLMLLENAEQQAARLGARVIGRPARSWLGVPLLIAQEPIGAIILQDPEREHAFNEDALRFVSALAAQVAGAIFSARLLEESRKRTLQLQTAAEIARDVGGSLNLDELLLKAVTLIRERFKFYHAAIFLVDGTGEYAVIREATGEAGAQMKRTGHKLAVGSKSIVGYVAGRGEALVVNETTRDATYYPNPLLPDTRAEAGIPIKLGERVLGVLDVQSNQPFAFGPEEVRTLQTLADQLAVAISNSELFAETQEHLAQHRLLHHITTSAASGSTLEEALESAVNGLQVTLGGDRVSILLLNKERNELEVRAAVGYSAEDIYQVRIPVGTGITGWVAQHRKLLRVDNTAEDPRYIAISANTRSELAIPIMYRNDLLGVLNVESEQLAAYTEHDEEMLGTLASSLAAIIANARLLQQVRRQAERERLLYEVTSKIRRSTDTKSILATTASELTRTIGVRRAHIKIAPPRDERESGDQK